MAATSDKDELKEHKKFSVVVAADNRTMGIGYKNKIPWRIPKDMEYFKNLTCPTDSHKMGVVIMGRRTYYSIPSRFRPLSGRVNVVLSRTMKQGLSEESRPAAPVIVVRSIQEWLKDTTSQGFDAGANFVIGGSDVYEEAIRMPECEAIYYTSVSVPDHVVDSADGSTHEVTYDCFFPANFRDGYELVSDTDAKEEETTCKLSFDVKDPEPSRVTFKFEKYIKKKE